MALYTKLANLIEMGSANWGEETVEISKELEEAGNNTGQLKIKILLMLEKEKKEIESEEMRVMGRGRKRYNSQL